MKKLTYHSKNFKIEFNKLCEELKDNFKKKAIEIVIKSDGIKFDGTHETKLTQFFTGKITNPCFFEFDSFMVESKRFIDYVIKRIVLDSGFPEPKKGAESFFNSLDPNFKGNRRKEYIKLSETNRKLVDYLWQSWNDWIKELHSYRTKSVHKYIPNEIHGSAETFWNSITKKEIPTKITLNNIYLDKLKLDEYVESLEKKLKIFLKECLKLFYDFKITLDN